MEEYGRRVAISARVRALRASAGPLAALVLAACQGGASPQPAVDAGADADGSTAPLDDPRFVEAAELSRAWCLRAQRLVAGVDETALPDEAIVVDDYEKRGGWSAAKVWVGAGDSAQVKLRSYRQAYCDPDDVAPEKLSEVAMCKLAKRDRLEAVLAVAASEPEGSCKRVNEAAFAWARSQLTAEELARYEASGSQVVFKDDLVVRTGGAWLGLETHFEPTGDAATFELQAPAMVIDYEPSNDPLTLTGVHYCKLITPEQALFWMLHRAYLADPGMCPAEAQCLHPDLVATGSCIFYFSPAGMHFCEEYTGAAWTDETAADKCASREGAYHSAACAERPEETAVLDDDGVHRGTCIVVCGEDERVWHVYSEPADGSDIAANCSMGFVPAD